jgi:hypothetical protein
MHIDNIDSQLEWVAHLQQEIEEKNIFLGNWKNCKIKNCRDPALGLDLPIHVYKVPSHLVTQSLKLKYG